MKEMTQSKALQDLKSFAHVKSASNNSTKLFTRSFKVNTSNTPDSRKFRPTTTQGRTEIGPAALYSDTCDKRAFRSTESLKALGHLPHFSKYEASGRQFQSYGSPPDLPHHRPYQSTVEPTSPTIRLYSSQTSTPIGSNEGQHGTPGRLVHKHRKHNTEYSLNKASAFQISRSTAYSPYTPSEVCGKWDFGFNPNISPKKLDSLTHAEMYRVNREKYKLGLELDSKRLRMKTRSLPDESFNLQHIKQELKIKPKPGRTLSHNALAMQRLRATTELNKELQKVALSKEDEQRVTVLRKKVAINAIFNEESRKSVPLEERKQTYKSLLLEFHPDKQKHDKIIAEEILTYLQSQKFTFLYDDKV